MLSTSTSALIESRGNDFGPVTFEESRLLRGAAMHALRSLLADLSDVRRDEAGTKQPAGPDFIDEGYC